jgi:D-serine dehydratase
LTHDVGVYLNAEKRIQASNPVAREMGRSLLPALQLWAYVQAVPEPNRAIIALGKRDAAFDAGMPITSLHYRPGSSQAPEFAPSDWKITAMMDQHAFMTIPTGANLQVGDMLAFDISHPCLTFDKWRQVLMVDEQYQVTGAVQTLF